LMTGIAVPFIFGNIQILAVKKKKKYKIKG
jgi:hypothetical protein